MDDGDDDDDVVFVVAVVILLLQREQADGGDGRGGRETIDARKLNFDMWGKIERKKDRETEKMSKKI